MSDDSKSRSAQVIAALVAVPLALFAGFGAFRALSPSRAPQPTISSSASPRPMVTSPVTMAAAPLDERAATVCRALLSQLPEQVRDLSRRPVSAGPEQNAAYGDPAVTLSCGGTMPSLPPTDLVYPMDNVCWHADAEGLVWTTVDREVPVTVSVPAEFEAPGQWVNAFSRSVAESVPSADQIPTGCGTR